MDKKLVMLIDDDLMSNAICTKVIQKNDPAVVVISMTSAIEAIDYLKNDRNNIPVLIILDLMMPAMNGWDFMKEYGKLNLIIEIVVLTSSKKVPSNR